MMSSGSDPRLTVLVVEDETLVRMFASDFLDEAGFKVFEAVNADEAVTVLRARPDIHVVLTDVEMPSGSMDGYELAKHIGGEWPGVRVIITSGRHAPPSDLPDEVPVILKPYLPATVVELIAQIATPQVIEPKSTDVA
jgi:CheY-like chemotaxis protein